MKKGIASEKKAIKEYKGSGIPNSGALWFAKGDLNIPVAFCGFNSILVQNKSTDKKSYTLKLADLIEIEDQALIDDKAPMFRVEFNGRKSYVILSEWLFKAMLEQYKDKKDE